jgi:hypothetical protein
VGGLGLGRTQKEREVAELLKVYADWETPGGGAPEAAMNLESMPGYNSGFPIAGRLSRQEKKLLSHSLENLRHALTMLRVDDYDAYSAINLAYLPDGADPSMVEDRRKKAGFSQSAKRFVIDHDRGIEDLAFYMRKVDLFVPWTRPRSAKEEKRIEESNAAIAADYEDLRRSGIKQDDAARRVGELHGVGRTRVLQIVEMRRLERGEAKRGRGRPKVS